MVLVQNGKRSLQPNTKIVVAMPFPRHDALEAAQRSLQTMGHLARWRHETASVAAAEAFMLSRVIQ